jgi:hypothetical protein
MPLAFGCSVPKSFVAQVNHLASSLYACGVDAIVWLNQKNRLPKYFLVHIASFALSWSLTSIRIVVCGSPSYAILPIQQDGTAYDDRSASCNPLHSQGMVSNSCP